MTNWDALKKEWETTEVTFKDLAGKYGLKDSTIRSRKNREKWERNATKKNATQHVSVATKKQIGAPKGNQRAKGNKGNPNPVKKFTERNSAALKHGFFSKYLPEETLAIMEGMNEMSPADLIYDQIQLQYAAIIRAQKIMFVDGQMDMTKELKKEKHSSGESGSSWEEEYEIQFAWDKHATYMNAQSRAMSELRSLIKQFNEMAYDDDERKLKLQQMQIGIEKTKAEIEKISTGGNDDGPIEIVISSKKTV